MLDISDTVVPKSDQLNADDLICGPKTITITGVKKVSDTKQPVVISFDGDNGKPFKPCLSMRRVLIHAWGKDGTQYVGRSMTLYLDETVEYGDSVVGGVRISSMSHISQKIVMALTMKRGRKKPYTVKPLAVQQPDKSALKAVLDQIAASTGKEGLSKAKEMAGKLTEEEVAIAVSAYEKRVAELKRAAQVNKETNDASGPDITITFAKVAETIEKSKDQDELDIAVDMIRLVEDELQRDELVGISRRVATAIGASESAASQA